MDITKLEYIYIDNDAKLIEAMEHIQNEPILGMDTETTGLNPHNNKIRLLQIASPSYPVLVIDMEAVSQAVLRKLDTLFLSDSIKIFQNAKFDLKFLIAHGFKIKGPIFDTMLAAQIVYDNNGAPGFGLDSLVEYYLGFKLSKEEQKSDWSGSITEKQIEYAAKDAAVLLPLRERLIKDIRKGNLVEVCKLEFDCVWAVVYMELYGIKLHKEKWESLYYKYVEEQREIAIKLNKELGSGTVQTNMFGQEEVSGINLDSQQQVIKALKKKGIEVNSTSQYELMEYRDKYEAVKWLLEYRRVSKAIQGFLFPIPQYINSVTNRLHSSYRQIGAGSGRFSCGNPNIQQIPRGKEFRECFVPEAGNRFVIADYSQIELRVAAEIAQDETMIDAYMKGQDLHALTAALIANKGIDQVTKQERQAAKAVNFGLIYAMGARGLQGYAKSVYGIDMSLEEAETFRERFFKAYRGIANWHSQVKRSQNVRECRTLSGRRCVFGRDPVITELLNIPVQGTAADIAKKALGMLVPVVNNLKGKIIATVHDEILLEVPETVADTAAIELKNIMEQAGAYYLKRVPVIAETIIADSWAEK